jgi:molybdopterin-guanine dinucleotide biosynthesis protein A
VGIEVSAAILAGGQARRLGGRDKSRLVVRGHTIIVRQVEVLQQITSDILLVSSHPERHGGLGLPVHADAVQGAGAMGGLLTALDAARHDLVLVVACDLPFLQAPLLRRLVDLAGGADGAWAAAARGPEPLLACYRRSARDRIREQVAAGRLRLGDLDRVLRMKRLEGGELAAYGDVGELLANVNTPDDLRRVQ